jgi:hypothetical protein
MSSIVAVLVNSDNPAGPSFAIDISNPSQFVPYLLQLNIGKVAAVDVFIQAAKVSAVVGLTTLPNATLLEEPLN